MEANKVNVICYCGKSLNDPTHASSHQDKFLTEKEWCALDHARITEIKVRKTANDPWRYLVSKRIGNTFHMIGIYQP